MDIGDGSGRKIPQNNKRWFLGSVPENKKKTR